jgi:hypothetical protein
MIRLVSLSTRKERKFKTQDSLLRFLDSQFSLYVYYRNFSRKENKKFLEIINKDTSEVNHKFEIL